MCYILWCDSEGPAFLLLYSGSEQQSINRLTRSCTSVYILCHFLQALKTFLNTPTCAANRVTAPPPKRFPGTWARDKGQRIQWSRASTGINGATLLRHVSRKHSRSSLCLLPAEVQGSAQHQQSNKVKHTSSKRFHIYTK